MLISHLSTSALRARLREGLQLKLGPFSARITSDVPGIAHGIATLYTDFSVETDNDFADFHVRLATTPGWRRWLRPQINFYFDGQKPFKPLPLDQAFAMMEWGLNWCITGYMHQYLVLHAAVLARDDDALILPGAPGAGKSTLTAALALRGWRLLSDELTLIDPQTGLLHGLARPVSLKNQSIDVIRAFAPEAIIGPIARDTAKGTVAHLKPSTLSVTQAAVPAKPAWVVFPRWEKDAALVFSPMSKSLAFMWLAEQGFNYNVHGETGFNLLTKTIDACSCHELRYSNLDEAVAAFSKLELESGHARG